ncbi:MAG: hypothetical protein RSE41_00275 [Clostridia bacterium]
MILEYRRSSFICNDCAKRHNCKLTIKNVENCNRFKSIYGSSEYTVPDYIKDIVKNCNSIDELKENTYNEMFSEKDLIYLYTMYCKMLAEFEENNQVYL